jgi:hypothetical protein
MIKTYHRLKDSRNRVGREPSDPKDELLKGHKAVTLCRAISMVALCVFLLSVPHWLSASPTVDGMAGCSAYPIAGWLYTPLTYLAPGGPPRTVLADAQKGDRFKLREGEGEGSLGWLAWHAVKVWCDEGNPNSDQALGAALTFPGTSTTLVPPDCWKGYIAPGDDSKPPEEQDREMNVGDWVWTSTGSFNSSGVEEALEDHMGPPARLIRVVIYDYDNGATGSNKQYYIARFALVYLKAKLVTASEKYIEAEFHDWESSCGAPEPTEPTLTPTPSAPYIAIEPTCGPVGTAQSIVVCGYNWPTDQEAIRVRWDGVEPDRAIVEPPLSNWVRTINLSAGDMTEGTHTVWAGVLHPPYTFDEKNFEVPCVIPPTPTATATPTPTSTATPTPDIDYCVTINDGALFTNQTAVTLTISAKYGTPLMQVSNDGGFAGAVWEPYVPIKPWTITEYGAYIIPRVVYVRFKDISGNTTATYQDDIILDVTAPTGSVEAVARVSGSSPHAVGAEAVSMRPIAIGTTDSYSYTIYLPIILKGFCTPPTGPTNVTLYLQAEDDVSGVVDMIISHLSSFNCARWEPYTTTKAWYAPEEATTVYVKFRDHAGNVSEVVTDTITW